MTLTPASAAAANRSGIAARRKGALYLGALALAAALFVPVVRDLQPQPVLALGWWVIGALCLAAGIWRKRVAWAVAGSLLLWGLAAACAATQLTEFGAPAGRVWGLRGLALTAALLEWVFL